MTRSPRLGDKLHLDFKLVEGFALGAVVGSVITIVVKWVADQAGDWFRIRREEGSARRREGRVHRVDRLKHVNFVCSLLISQLTYDIDYPGGKSQLSSHNMKRHQIEEHVGELETFDPMLGAVVRRTWDADDKRAMLAAVRAVDAKAHTELES